MRMRGSHAALFGAWPFREKGRFLFDTLSLAAGTALAQAIAIAVSPVLTRLYSPEQFGVFSLYSAILSAGSAVVCLSYEPAILLPKDDSEGASILVACIAISVLVAGGALVGVYLLGKWLADLLKAPVLVSLLWLAPLNLCALGVYQALSYWTNRRGRFTQSSGARVWQSGGTALSQLGAGFAGGGASGLVYGQIAGQALSSAALAVNATKADFPSLQRGVSSMSALAPLLKRYGDFPRYSTWGSLMNTATFQLVPVVLSTLYGPETVGFYFLGYRVINVPMSLLGVALGQVLLQRAAAQLSRGGSISRLVEVVIGRQVLLSAPVFLLILVAAPWMFATVFGRGWITAGRFIQVLSPLFMVQFITSPASVILIALERQRLLTLLQGLLLVSAIGSLGVGARVLSSPLQSLALYSLSVSVVYLIYLYAIVRCSSASLRAIAAESASYTRLYRGM